MHSFAWQLQMPRQENFLLELHIQNQCFTQKKKTPKELSTKPTSNKSAACCLVFERSLYHALMRQSLAGF